MRFGGSLRRNEPTSEDRYPMRVVIAGATGLIGRALTAALSARGDQVVALTRSEQSADGLRGQVADIQLWPEPKVDPPPASALTGTDAVVNLLGAPVAQRWTESAKREIRDSRVLGTRSLVAGLRELAEDVRPKSLVNASAVGYYGPRGEEPLDESEPPGSDFLAQVTADWEREALAASERSGVRVVLLRTGVVLAQSGGALGQMLPPFRLGVGGPVAGGRQYVPWIHLNDEVGAIVCCLDEPRCTGPLNLAAPNPVTNAELSKGLGRILHRPAVLPVPALALRLLYGEMASVVIGGQRAVPRALEAVGYGFTFPELDPALRDLLAAGG
jgi:uncharacterized protein (TIGR01777 family)